MSEFLDKTGLEFFIDKLDKGQVKGKGLSTNNFTNEDKESITNLQNSVTNIQENISAIQGNIPTKTSELENDSDYVTTTQVDNRFEQLVGAAPADLDTLEELAEKLQDGDDIHTALVQSISEKASKTEVSENYLAKPAGGTEGQILSKTADGSMWIDNPAPCIMLESSAISSLYTDGDTPIDPNNLTAEQLAALEHIRDKFSPYISTLKIYNGIYEFRPCNNPRVYIHYSYNNTSSEIYPVLKSTDVEDSCYIYIRDLLPIVQFTEPGINSEAREHFSVSIYSIYSAKPEGDDCYPFHIVLSKIDEVDQTFTKKYLLPENGTEGQVLTNTANGAGWADNLKSWIGTEEQYNAIVNKDANTLYCIPE